MIFPLLFSLACSVIGDVTMVKVFGKVPDVSLENEVVKPSEECIDDCFNSPECILVFMDTNSHCLQYDYNSSAEFSVVETESADGFIVAIKTLFPESICPASHRDIQFVSQVEEDWPMSWFNTSTGWILKKCEDSWTRFEREDSVIVCMKGYALPIGSNKTTAEELCVDKGHVITGVASVQECLWLQGQLLLLLGSSFAEWYGLWIDGIKNCTVNDENCRNFAWSDGYTTGNEAFADGNVKFSGEDETCLSVTKLYGESITLNDVGCTDEKRFESGAGVACGYRLQLSP